MISFFVPKLFNPTGFPSGKRRTLLLSIPVVCTHKLCIVHSPHQQLPLPPLPFPPFTLSSSPLPSTPIPNPSIPPRDRLTPQKFLQPLRGIESPKTTHLDPPVRQRGLIMNRHTIDMYGPALHPPRDLQSSPQILREDRAREAVLGVIGQHDGLGVGVDDEE